jgi:serine/threonine-protein kinase
VTNTTAGVVKGKYMYMAPEQARSGTVDRRADVFSLGVSLYEALTNVRPFARDNDLAILNAVLQCDYTPPRQVRPDLPVELEALVQKALKLDPGLRYQSGAELASELERFLAATTSGSGATQLSQFMHAFFGPERVSQKTRIDSLPDLAGKGWDVPGYVNPNSPKTDPSHTPPGSGPRIVRSTSSEEPTKAVGGSTPSVVERKKRLGAAAIGALVAVAVMLVGGGTLVGVFGFRVPLGGVTVTSGDPPITAVVDAGPAVAEGVDAGGPATAAVVDAGPQPQQAFAKPVCPSGVKPTTLVMRAIKDRYSELTGCFEKHKTQLPEDQGKLMVTFRIAPNGKITEAKADLPSAPKVTGCVEERIKTVRVSCYNGGDATANLPLQWSVKR